MSRYKAVRIRFVWFAGGQGAITHKESGRFTSIDLQVRSKGGNERPWCKKNQKKMSEYRLIAGENMWYIIIETIKTLLRVGGPEKDRSFQSWGR